MIATAERPAATAWQYHEACSLFPPHDDETLAKLKASIAERGILVPVVTWQDPGGVLWVADGRARVEIALGNGIEIPTTEFRGNEVELIEHVISLNRDRRQMTAGQLACLAVDSEAMLKAYRNPGGRCGRPLGSNRSAQGRAVDEVARKFGSNRSNLQKAKKLKKAAPGLYQQVKDGSKSVGEALREAEQPKRTKPPAGTVLDQLGRLLPERLHEVAEFASDIEEIAREITGAMRKLKEMAAQSDRPGSITLKMALPSIENELREAASTARDCKLFTVCPICSGTGCNSCARQGWLTQSRYKQLPQGVRDKHAGQRA